MFGKYMSQIPGIGEPLTEEQQQVLISEIGFEGGSPPVQFLMEPKAEEKQSDSDGK